MTTASVYPVRVEAAAPDPALSRWLWLVKWLLVTPHYIVLALLWAAFAVLSVIAFFAILITGRYPRSIFEFNVGVLRWSWRVAYYAYGALGTDRYPPFTLDHDPSYPARLEVTYPDSLSRGLVLVKWWLLALPHYAVVALLLGAAWAIEGWTFLAGGLLGLLVLAAGVTLLFTGRYPTPLFDLILGLNRWVLRVAAYAGLMTDEYPPFRLDQGGHDPAGTLTVPSPSDERPTEPGWTGLRITSLVAGSILSLTSLGLLIGGGIGLWADRTQRDTAGFITSSRQSVSTDGYAIISEAIAVEFGGARVAGSLLGEVRLRVTTTDPAREVFVGIGPSSEVDVFLGEVQRTLVGSFAEGARSRDLVGGAPELRPASLRFWVASASGSGTQTIRWPIEDGSWTIVAMDARGVEKGLTIAGDIGATLPALGWMAVGLLATGGILLLAAVPLIAMPIVRASRRGARPSGVPGQDTGR